MYGGYGLTNNVDLSLRFGLFDGVDYFGADMEWGLANTGRYAVSVITGVHNKEDFGLDIGAKASFPLGKHATIITGVDSDFNFDRNNTRNFWIPIGVEISWKKRMSAIIEADIPASEWAPHIFGGGVLFYLP